MTEISIITCKHQTENSGAVFIKNGGTIMSSKICCFGNCRYIKAHSCAKMMDLSQFHPSRIIKVIYLKDDCKVEILLKNKDTNYLEDEALWRLTIKRR